MQSGEQVFLRGPSGSGKSTLLGLIAGVLLFQGGRLEVLGEDMSALGSAQKDQLRANRMGVVFQMFNLLPWLGVGENITLPCRFSARRAERVESAGGLVDEAKRLLERLGLDPEIYWSARASDLSVGQQQRVAVARALIGSPDLIIADEPTSALDTDLRNRFIDLLKEETSRTGAGLLFVSHDQDLADHFTRIVDLAEINRIKAEAA